MVTYLIIFAAAVLPGMALWFYIWLKDKKPEPFGQLLKATLWGVLISIPAILIEYIIEYLIFGDTEPVSFIDHTIEAFCVAAIPEEGLKLGALWWVLRKNPHFDEHYDGIVYAVCVGLGFAGIENIMYLFGSMDEWASIGIVRAIFAVPGHYINAVLMGYYYARYHFVNRSFLNLVSILLMPILAHGLYDSIVMNISTNEYLILPMFSLLIFFCVKMHKLCRRRIQAQIELDEQSRWTEQARWTDEEQVAEQERWTDEEQLTEQERWTDEGEKN